MNFALTDAQESIREAVANICRDFSQRNRAPNSREEFEDLQDICRLSD